MFAPSFRGSVLISYLLLVIAIAFAFPGCGGSDGNSSTGDGDGDGAGGSGGEGPDETGSGGISSGGTSSSGGKSGNGGSGGNENVSPELSSLHIAPNDVTLISIDGTQPSEEFTVTALFSDGSEIDVTDEATFELNEPSLGAIVENEFVSNGRKGGVVAVTATLDGKTATTTVTVDVTIVHLFEPTTAEIPSLFVDANPQQNLSPALVYPEPGSIAPPNLVELDVHFTDPTSENDVFEISVERTHFHLRAYLVDTAQSTHFATLSGDLWDLIRLNAEGASVNLRVRGLASEEPSQMGVSLSQSLHIASGPSEGQIFYRSESVSLDSGIYRYLMDDGAAAIGAVYTSLDEPTQQCVSCHSPSADGSLLAATLIGGGGLGTVINTDTAETVVPAISSWNFASFDPGSDEMVTVKDGIFTVRNSLTGAVITDVSSAEMVTHPAFNADGSVLAYVRMGETGPDWAFVRGSILTRAYSRQNHTFGEEVMLVESTETENNYYPTFSPDGEFILFNRSTGTSMMDPTSALYVIDAAGENDPIPLASANKEGPITNSRPAWSRSSSALGTGSDEEPVLWFVFASKRNFGVRLAANTRLQLWIAPFFPQRARNGEDPSGPALRLPLQDIGYNNYLATWIE